MTGQEVLEKVVLHLFEQGERSVRPCSTGIGEACAYVLNRNNQKPLMCAVGVLIPKEKYDSSMEDMDVEDLVREFKDILPSSITKHKMLLSELQAIHDRSTSWETTESMKRALLAMRNEFLALGIFQLDFGFIDNLSFKDR